MEKQLRIMPHNEEAERSVIGSMIMDKDAISDAIEILTKEDFYESRYAVFFEVITSMFGKNVVVDIVTLTEKLRMSKLPEEYTSLNYIAGIVESVPTSANVKYYAKIVKDNSLLRNFITVSGSLIQTCYEHTDSSDKIFERAEKELFRVFRNVMNTKDFVPIDRMVLNSLVKIEQAAKSGGRVTGIPSGFLDLDYKTTGFKPGNLVLIAARPSMGKTAFALNIAEYMAVRKDYTTCFFSLEMSQDEVIERLLSMGSRIDSYKIKSGKLDDGEWTKLMEGARELGSSKLIIDGWPGMTMAELRQRCRKMKLENDLKCVIVDYLQLLKGSSEHKNESKQLEVQGISQDLKALAREIECPVIALSQLSRSLEKREDKRPILSDLRDSGAIEQDADIVMFIHREFYHDHSKDSDKAEIIIAKQRTGSIGTVELKWIPENTRFANIAK